MTNGEALFFKMSRTEDVKTRRKPSGKMGDSKYLGSVKRCARCTIEVGGKHFYEPRYKIWKFTNREFILCPPCFKVVKNVKTQKDFSIVDKRLNWHQKRFLCALPRLE